VRGDFQARFCERFRVKFPLPTRCRIVREYLITRVKRIEAEFDGDPETVEEKAI